ncbi:hypothetical protein, partial [Curtobacterium citreum]
LGRSARPAVEHDLGIPLRAHPRLHRLSGHMDKTSISICYISPMIAFRMTRPTAAVAAAAALAALMSMAPTVAHAANAGASEQTEQTEQIKLVVERQADTYMSFDLRADGAVVMTSGLSRTFDVAAESAATVSAPMIGETGKVVFENGKCLQAFGPASNGWTIVSNSCDERGTLWERTASGALQVIGEQPRAMEYFGNANVSTKRAVTGFEYPVGVASTR